MKEADRTGLGRVVAAGLRKQAPTAHLDADSLTAFAENALPDFDRERTLAHLAECAGCRETLFLAQPQAGDEPRIFVSAKTAFSFRWVAVGAAAVIVVSVAFLARREFERQPEKMAGVEQTPTVNANVADKKAEMPARLDKEETAVKVKAAIASGRPEPKHMTAKPEGTLEFSSNDEVRIANAPAPAPAIVAPSATANEIASTAGQGNGNGQGAQQAAAQTSRADKVEAKDSPQVTAETVTVTGENAQMQTDAGAANREASASLRKSAAAGYANEVLVQIPPTQWQVSPTGGLQRSYDQGKTWQDALVAGKPGAWRAVFSSGTQVWVGGNAGALYHSADSGLTWKQVTPSSGQQKLSGDIVHIEFGDPQNGKVSTSDGQLWTTADGGQSWNAAKLQH